MNKSRCIDILLSEYKKGVSRSDCMSKYVDEWQISTRTFDRYWKEVKEKFEQEKKIIRQAELKERIKLGKERAHLEIMSKNEVLETLTKLGKGEAWKVGNEIIAPTANERINAIREISKLQGYYEPEEVEVKGGLDLEINASKVVKDILKKLND